METLFIGQASFVKTYHYSLKHLLAQRVTTSEQQRLLMKLFPFDFTIIYKSGKENQGVDALSRRLQHADFMALVLLVNIYFLNLHEGNDFLGGHGGYLKTLKRLTENFFWLQMKRDVKTHVRNCLVCQQNKYQTLAPAGLLQPLPIVFGKIYPLNFILGLPESGGVDTILVVVDRLSKYSHFLPLAHPFMAKSMAALFCKEIVRLHGMPRSILSERDVIFLSNFWQELFRLSQTRLRMGITYHPQSDGQTEVVNRCLEAYLRCFAHERPSSWSKFMAWAEYSFNTGYHTSSETTPFKALYGRDPPALNPYVKAQSRMKAQTSSKRRELSFEVGDAVLLRIHPFRQRSLSKQKFEKLSPRYFGPYVVVRRVGPVAYELALPEDSKVHLIFHVSLLRATHGQSVSQPPTPLPITVEWEQILVPDKILTHRWISGSNTLELLVQWQNRPVEEATWEDYDLLSGQFPHFCLEDKASFPWGSTDRKLIHTYSIGNKSNGKREEFGPEINHLVFQFESSPYGLVDFIGVLCLDFALYLQLIKSILPFISLTTWVLTALEVLPAYMEAQTKAEVNKKAHNAVIVCSGNKMLREVTRETTAAGVWTMRQLLMKTVQSGKLS
nr:peroxidase 64 [Tanacetum cinerariifolium]